MKEHKATHCICFHKSFEEIKQIAKDRRLTNTKQVVLATKCGTKCKMCLPYIRRMMNCGI